MGADQVQPALPPRQTKEVQGASPMNVGQAPPALPRRHQVEVQSAPTTDAGQSPPRLPPRRQIELPCAPPMDTEQAPPALPPRLPMAVQSAPPMGAGRAPPALPPRGNAVVQGAPTPDADQAPPGLPHRPGVTPSSTWSTPHHRAAEGGNTAGGVCPAPAAVSPAPAGMRDSTPPQRPPPNGDDAASPPSYHDVMNGNAGYFPVSASKFGRMFGGGGEGNGGGGGEVGDDSKTPDGESTLDERMSKLEKKKNKAQYLEYAVNGAEYADQWQGNAGMIREGAQAVEVGAESFQASAELSGLTAAQVDAGVQEIATDPTIAEVTGGATDIAGETVTTNIVEGHEYHECIDGTCLETPVKFVAEECAVPMYRFIGDTCCRCFCSNGASENVDNAREAADTTDNFAGGAEEGLGHAKSCFSSVCACFDMSDFCVADEALAYALPFCGLLFSLYRLYQGSSLSFRSCLGLWSGGNQERVGFQWMMAEGHARLWQGCCGLLGAAPGLIIVTLPSILACSLVARKAQKNRLLFDKKDAPEAAGTDPETGEAIPVVTAQPFPSDENRKRFYDEAYEAVSGRLKPDQITSREFLEDSRVPKGEYPKTLTGQWSTGVFDCLEHVPSCVTAFFCSCITTGQVAEGARLFSGVFYVSIVVFLFDFLVGFGGWLWIMFATYAVAVSRARIAGVYDIPLNRVENWCLSLWCNCCVATQVARHLFAWGKHSSKYAGWSECGPKPASRWPAPPASRQSSYQPGYYEGGSIPPGQEVYIVPEARVIVHQPVAVAPMVR